MRKVLVIAAREYLAVVRSKAFFISLVLLPVMMFAPSLLERATRKVQDVRDRRFAVIDRTPGQAVYTKLGDAVETRNARVASPAGARQSEPRFVLEPITPAGADSTEAAALQQRYELAQRVRTGELFGIVDIGADVLT